MQQTDNTLPLYLVDDDMAACQSLAILLEDCGFQVAAFTEGNAFLQAVQLDQPGCVILDSRMPGLSGAELHQRLIQQRSPLSVIFLTGFGDVPMAVQALQTGATHFFQKPVQVQELIPAIEAALRQSVQQAEKQQLREAFDALTERERDILKLLVCGHRNQHIAEVLCIAVRTVEVHRASLMKKFAANTIAELAFFYGRLETP